MTAQLRVKKLGDGPRAAPHIKAGAILHRGQVQLLSHGVYMHYRLLPVKAFVEKLFCRRFSIRGLFPTVQTGFDLKYAIADEH
jgi:hypothetical protein